MKGLWIIRCSLIIVLLLAGIKTFSQQFPAFKPLRYDEDYTVLKNDTLGGWYRKLKFSSLSADKKLYISYGGEIRTQYFYNAPEDKNGYVLARGLLHADIHAGKNFRSFIQLQSSIAGNRIDAGPVDHNPLEFHQAFVDIKTTLQKNSNIVLRAGRQEFLFGSQRLVAVREGPNNRQSFDALRVLLTADHLKADFFYSHHVAARKGIFNDGWNSNTRLWGSYCVINGIPMIQNADIYYLGLYKTHAVFDDGSGKEIRHSFGTRIWGRKKDWRYDVEAVYQRGKLARNIINAWTASINTSYQFSHAKFQPEIGMKTELISGDQQPGDGKLQTFNPLFPRGAYFGLAAVIGPANLFDVHPSVAFTLAPNLVWTIDIDLFWRYSVRDGIYGPNTALIYSGTNARSRFVARQLATDFSYTPNPFLYFRVEFTWLRAGDFLREVGAGKDIIFTGVTAQLKF